MQNRFWYLLSKKLSGQLSDMEAAELTDLEARHPEWRESGNHTTNLWGHDLPLADAQEDFDRHIKRMAEQGIETSVFSTSDKHENEAQESVFVKPLRKKWWFWMAAAASFIGFIGWLFVTQFSKEPVIAAELLTKNEVTTARGKREKLVLPDGTNVWLNAESKIEYGKDFNKTNRDITLSGEAYFDVTKNKKLPFTIQTNKIHIKVTGTVFNVKAYPSDKISETSIIEGRVEVTVNDRPKELYVLKPNEKLVIRNEPVLDKSVDSGSGFTNTRRDTKPLIQLGYVNPINDDADSATVETSWIYNRLVFDNESIADMAIKMERWYGVKIVVSDAKVGAIRLNYQIKNETIEKALRNMQYVARFHYTIVGNEITITK
jgi:transmembrane sensor